MPVEGDPVGVMQRVLSAFGYTPFVVQQASEWADDSHLADIDLRDLFYLGDNVMLTRGNAMKIATVAKVRNVVAGTIGRLPLYDQKGAERSTVYRSILAQPDPSRTRSSLLTWTVDQLIFYPCTWWEVTRRDSYGWPADVQLVMHETAETNAKGDLVKVSGRPVSPGNVIRFDSPNSGLLVDGERALRRAVVIELAAAKAEDNPVPGFELHNEGDQMTAAQIDELLGNWIKARRKHGVGFTSKGVKAVAHGAAPENLLIDGRKRIDLELCRHLNAPAWVADVAVEGASLTYNNRASRNWELIDLACSPYMTAIVDRLSMGDVTPLGWQVKFDIDDLTKPDMQTRFTAYKTGIDGKFVTVEQIAAWEGWPVPAGVAS